MSLRRAPLTTATNPLEAPQFGAGLSDGFKLRLDTIGGCAFHAGDNPGFQPSNGVIKLGIRHANIFGTGAGNGPAIRGVSPPCGEHCYWIRSLATVVTPE